MVKIRLSAGNLEKKQIIVNKFVNSGINITPSSLELVLTLDNPEEKVNVIIKEASFSPTFNGHLTVDVLNNLSQDGLLKILKRKQIASTPDLNIEYPHQIETDSSNKEEIRNELIISASIKQENKKEIQIPTLTAQSVIESPPTIAMQSIEESSKKAIKEKKKAKIYDSAKSTLTFNPIAKDYDADFKILKDPTGKLYTSGDYEDFYDLTIDKYQKLQALMNKHIRDRPGLFPPKPITTIRRNSQSVPEISISGLVNNIRQTKNGHYMVEIEDDTGVMNVLVNKNSENQEYFTLAEKIVNDQMVYIQGTYNPGEKNQKGGGIIFADTLLRIDVDPKFEPNYSPDPLSIVYLSDLHIGSKEFEEKLWNKFIKLINGNLGDKTHRDMAGRVKYIIINGDLVEGVGIYPRQENDLNIIDIYKQFERAAELLSEIPDYIKIFFSSGNHDPVRNAIPRPAVPKKYAEDLLNIGVKCIGNPAVIKTHNVETLIYHGDSMLDMNLLVPTLENDKPVDTMVEFLQCRHLAPIYGNKTQIAPTSKDWLVIDKVPDVFHTGHVHINGVGKYHNVTLINSGCFQSQTDFMASVGIHPTPGLVSIVELDTLKTELPIDLKKL